MTFEEYKVKYNELEKSVKLTTVILKDFPRNAIGLVSDTIKLSPDYQLAKRNFNLAFNELRNFNQIYTKFFKKELQIDRQTRYNERTRLSEK